MTDSVGGMIKKLRALRRLTVKFMLNHKYLWRVYRGAYSLGWHVRHFFHVMSPSYRRERHRVDHQGLGDYSYGYPSVDNRS